MKRWVGELSRTRHNRGAYVDALKCAGGSFSLTPRGWVKELPDICHEHDVLVSTGGFMEYVLTQGPEAVQK